MCINMLYTCICIVIIQDSIEPDLSVLNREVLYINVAFETYKSGLFIEISIWGCPYREVPL